MKPFIGCFVPKKSQAEKFNLATYTVLKNAPNKKAASIIIAGEFFQNHADIAEHYFDVKIIEDGAETDRPALNEWSTDFTWNKEANSVELTPLNQSEEESNPPQDYVDASKLPTNLRAALLALFGPLEHITKAEYGQAIDLTNDTEPGFEKELSEAISRTPSILGMTYERQSELLKATRKGVKESAQWTDMKKFMDKWLSSPPAPVSAGAPISLVEAARQKLAAEKIHTPSGAIAGGQSPSDRGEGFVMTLDVLALEIALGLVGRSMDFDIYNPPGSVVNRARDIINNKEKPFPKWFDAWRNMPSGLDYSRAAVIHAIKYAPDNIELRPGALIGYLSNTLTESDHANPAPEIVAAACGAVATKEKQGPFYWKGDDAAFGKVSTLAEFSELIGQSAGVSTIIEIEEAEYLQLSTSANSNINEQNTETLTPVCTEHHNKTEKCHGRTVFSLEELTGGPDKVSARPERPEVSQREIEICHELNKLLSGRTDVISAGEAAEMILNTGHHISDVLPRLVSDIATTEFNLTPDFSDEEIHSVATSIIDSWSDNEAKRLATALDEITEWRSPVHDDFKPETQSASPIEQKEEFVSEQIITAAAPALTYHQQLTLAAIHGLCANPACFGVFDDIPGMADSLADSVLNIQEPRHAR